MTIGEKLRLLKRESGYTLVKIEEESGIPTAVFCGYMSGRRRPALWAAVDLARTFGITVEQLLDGVQRWQVDGRGYLADYRPRWTMTDQDVDEKRPA